MEIEARFREEQANIRQYVESTSKLVAIDDRALREINTVFRLNHLPRFFQRRSTLNGKPFSNEQLNGLLKAINESGPLIDIAIAELESLAETANYDWDNDPERPHRQLFVDLVQWFLDNLPESPTADQLALLSEKAFDNLTEYESFIEDPARSEHEGIYRNLISQAVSRAELERAIGRLMQLRPLRAQFDQMRLFCRMQLPDAEVNILRQSFILLITAFDAAVFDLTRAAIRADFFSLIARFGEKDSISLKDMSRYSSLEDFRDQTIDDRLRKLYVKDVLRLFQVSEVAITADGNKREFTELMEFIRRRNVHVHNRGIVDRGFLHGKGEKEPDVNLYKLELGERATIDEPYFARANELLGDCVHRIADWANCQARKA